MIPPSRWLTLSQGIIVVAFIYRERTHVNSKGFNEFCIRNIERHSLGRREIELAELEMPGILALRQEDILKFFPIQVSIIFLKS